MTEQNHGGPAASRGMGRLLWWGSHDAVADAVAGWSSAAGLAPVLGLRVLSYSEGFCFNSEIRE